MTIFQVLCRARVAEDKISYDIHTYYSNFILGMLVHTFFAKQLGVIAKLLPYTENDMFR